jgi:hypothetical protein
LARNIDGLEKPVHCRDGVGDLLRGFDKKSLVRFVIDSHAATSLWARGLSNRSVQLRDN